MNVRLRLLGAFLTLFGGTVAAQDVQDVLQAVSANMGADNLNCVTYTATGYVGLVGQTFDIRSDWPRVAVSDYTRSVNYTARSMHEERVLTQGDYPARGGGRQPIQGERRRSGGCSRTTRGTCRGTIRNLRPTSPAGDS